MPFFPEQDNILQLNEQQFDFNIQFEQLFFSIIPSVLFIITSLWRAASQLRKPTVVNAPVFQLIKLVTNAFRHEYKLTNSILSFIRARLLATLALIFHS